MSEQNNQFLPEQVDEQIEALSQHQVRRQPGSSASARLVANLHQVFQEESEIGEQVWVRLARYAAERRRSVALSSESSTPAPGDPNVRTRHQHPLFSTHSGEKPAMRPIDQQPTQSFPALSRPDTLQEERPGFARISSLPQNAHIPARRKRLPRFFALAAIVLVSAVLISSVALAFTLLKRNTQSAGPGPGSPTAAYATTPIPTPTISSSVPPECQDTTDQADETLCAQHAETMLNITKTFGGHEVTFVRAYADLYRLMLIYTTNDPPQSLLISFASVAIQQGITLSSGNNYIVHTTGYQNPETHQHYFLINFDTQSIPPGTTTLTIKSIVDSASNASTPLSFTVPINTAQKTVAVHQTVTSQSVDGATITLTLDHLTIYESMVVGYFRASKSSEDGNYALDVYSLSINGHQLSTHMLDTSVGYWEGPDTFVVDFHHCLLNQVGTWTFTVIPISASTISSIKWTFSFTVQG